MKILFFGAGVIGQIYAARLFNKGVDVALLARGENYQRLKNKGVSLHNVLTKDTIHAQIPLVQQLKEADDYDLVIVTVRLDQLESAKDSLKLLRKCPALLFMLNNPKGVQGLDLAFPGKRIVLGFPGVGGIRQGGQLNYVQIKEQKTTLGDFNGPVTDFTKGLKEIFEKSGFSVALEENMKAWLIIHSVFISCASASIALSQGDSVQLGKSKSGISNMIQSIREGFKACQDMGLPIVPPNLKTIFMTMPKWFSVLYWQKAMKGKTGTLAIAPHVNAAKEEMQLLSRQVLDIVGQSSVETPTLSRLLSAFIQLK